jgi:hypothetical protein
VSASDCSEDEVSLSESRVTRAARRRAPVVEKSVLTPVPESPENNNSDDDDDDDSESEQENIIREEGQSSDEVESDIEEPPKKGARKGQGTRAAAPVSRGGRGRGRGRGRGDAGVRMTLPRNERGRIVEDDVAEEPRREVGSRPSTASSIASNNRSILQSRMNSSQMSTASGSGRPGVQSQAEKDGIWVFIRDILADVQDKVLGNKEAYRKFASEFYKVSNPRVS